MKKFWYVRKQILSHKKIYNYYFDINVRLFFIRKNLKCESVMKNATVWNKLLVSQKRRYINFCETAEQTINTC
jgi:hypothetical protein